MGESAEGTIVTTVGPTITDAAGNVYPISPAGYVMTNGQPETMIPASVVELAYHAPVVGAVRQLYQKNAGGTWFTRTSVTATYTDAVDPFASTTPAGVVSNLPAPIGSAANTIAQASGNTILLDLTKRQGWNVPACLYGVSCGHLTVDGAPYDYHSLSIPAFQAAIRSMSFGLVRLNWDLNYTMDRTFGSGTTPNWADIDNFLVHKDLFGFSAGTLLIITGGWPSSMNSQIQNNDSSIAATLRSQYQQIAQHFKNAGITGVYWGSGNETNDSGFGVPVPIYGFEIGNEEDGHVSDADYCSYFNAAAAALHALNANWRMFGTVDSFMTSTAPDGRFVTFAKSCGNNPNVVLDYHGYSYGKQVGVDSRTNQELFTNQPANDASVARQTVAGTSLANAEIFMGEWNMDYNAADEIRQQQPIGGCFAAYWMASALKSHHGVTMGAMWETYGDNYYGAIQGAGTIVPSGRLLQKAAAVMGGNEVGSTFKSEMPCACRSRMATISA